MPHVQSYPPPGKAWARVQQAWVPHALLLSMSVSPGSTCQVWMLCGGFAVRGHAQAGLEQKALQP